MKCVSALFQLSCLTPCLEVPSASSLMSVPSPPSTLHIHTLSQHHSEFLNQMCREGAGLPCLSVLKEYILSLLHFLAGQTGRNSADVLVMVQEDEKQSIFQLCSPFFSLRKFLQNLLKGCVFGIKGLEAQLISVFFFLATSFSYFNLISIRQQTFQQTER